MGYLNFDLVQRRPQIRDGTRICFHQVRVGNVNVVAGERLEQGPKTGGIATPIAAVTGIVVISQRALSCCEGLE